MKLFRKAGLCDLPFFLPLLFVPCRKCPIMAISTEKELRLLYNLPSERAVQKELCSLEKHSALFIQTTPFLVLSSYSKDGAVDASPRGGEPGFVQIINNSLIAIPDAKGNNRLDSLTNIMETANVGLLFLIPGVDETLRLNGRAEISNDDEHLSLFKDEKNPPKSVILIHIEKVFMHCAKAFMRSKLWDANAQIERGSFPSMGEILKDQLKIETPAESHEDMVKRYQKDI
ncbi:MAG: PPOX class probable FMN-dependent enzyme [Flavobacteriales bacterium]